MQTDKLALLPSVKRQVFGVWDMLKTDKHKVWNNNSIVTPKLADEAYLQMKPVLPIKQPPLDV